MRGSDPEWRIAAAAVVRTGVQEAPGRGCAARRGGRVARVAALAAAAALLGTQAAWAGTGGTDMPWNGPMQAILDNITGPTGKIIAGLLIALGGIVWGFTRHEEGFKRVAQAIVAIGLILGATNLVTTLGFQGVCLLTVPEAHVIHSALHRPVLMAGVDRGLVIVEATLVTALVVMGGLDWRTLGAAALVVAVLHPAMAWATRGDAAIAEVYVRSLGAQDFYPAAASWRARPAAVRPAIPPLGG